MQQTIKVFSKDNCPRCRMLTNRLQNYGIEHEYHHAEAHKEPHENWRTNGSVEFMAGLSHHENELPITVIEDHYYSFEEAMDMATDKMHNKLIEHGEKKGYTVDMEILADVEKNDFLCPCRVTPVRCPCPGHAVAIEQVGKCACGLYTKKTELMGKLNG